jgi:3-phenylpropionate/trans-cinnamate dioxygenase ferredoxin subunit
MGYLSTIPSEGVPVSVAHKVASTAEIDPGETKRVRVGDEIIALYNCDGAFYATDDTCSHAEASLSDGWLEDCEITCPLHGAIFDVTTGVPQCLPATKPIRTYPVRVEGDEIFVEV